MSQVVSVVVKSHFEQACSMFRDEADISDNIDNSYSDCGDFIVVYDESLGEIRCEGHLSDSVISSLITVKDQFGGKLFYEGEVWNEDEVIEEESPIKKTWIILAIVIFPVTLIYLILRIVIWVPYKLWKATK